MIELVVSVADRLGTTSLSFWGLIETASLVGDDDDVVVETFDIVGLKN